MNRLQLLPDDIIADIFEINRQQDLQKIHKLENEIKNLIKAHNDEANKKEFMKDTLLDNGYTFCDICESFAYEPDDWFDCGCCFKPYCLL